MECYLGQDNLFSKASEAKDKYTISGEKEQLFLTYTLIKNDNSNSNSESISSQLQNELNSDNGNPKTLITGNSDSIDILYLDTNHYFHLENGEIQYIGNVSSIPENAVVRVGTTFYSTLQEAIDSVPNNEKTTIVFLKNISENVTIPVNKIITLNMSYYKLKPIGLNRNITVNGILELENGTIEATYEGGYSEIVYINQSGEVKILNNVTLTGGNCDILANDGKLEILGNSTIFGNSRRICYSNMLL